LPKLFYWTNAESNNSFEYLCDFHPDIQKHLQLVEEQIYPTLGLKINQNKKDRLLHLHETIKNDFKHRKKNRQKETQIIQNIICNNYKDIDFYQKSLVDDRIVT
jgi:hypothetical protein